MIKKLLACGAVSSALLAAAQPAAADIPNPNPGPNCFGGATSYGNQLNVVLYGAGSGAVLLSEGINPGQWQQYYRTDVCGG
jgi:hypothetical protein